jgi:hypothetical protein
MDETCGRGRVLLVGGLVLAAVLILGFVFLFQSGKPAAQPSLPPTAAAVPESEIGETLATFDELGSGPAVLQPGPIMNQSREILDEAVEQQKTREESL